MNQQNQHFLQCDVLVAGGGPAGVPCALAAARQGAKVILVHDRPVLGGNASSEVRMHIVGADGCQRGGLALEREARESGIIEEIRLEAAVQNPHSSPSMMDFILYDKCIAEPNLQLLLNTTVSGAEVREGRIVAATAERSSTEDRFRIEAKVFVDCTGDGRLGVEAGADFRVGREGRDEYCESLAQPKADHKRLGSTLLFMARKWDSPQPYTPPVWARRITAEDLKYRLRIDDESINRGLEYGYWWLEWGGELDTIKDNEQIRHELLAVLFGTWDFIKNRSGSRVAENWALDWVGFVPGKRESRRFLGHHVMTEHDVMQSTAFEDAIAYGGWSIDLHPAEGIDASNEKPCIQHAVPYVFDIPLRACASRNVGNLLFAGRNISATHVAFAATRVMATCAVMGQGVGTAAAYAVRKGVEEMVRIASSKEMMREVQQSLLEQDSYLIGIANEDEKDLARGSEVTASSFVPGGEPANVISGFTRSIHGPKGAPEGRAPAGTHRWMSDPAEGTPAWIGLKFDRVISLRRVNLVFDTGLHRLLTLTHLENYRKAMIWGRPQPETVRDYAIAVWSGGEWRRVLEVTGNYQRLRTHTLPEAVSTDRLRLEVLGTNGLDHARLMEIRVYEEERGTSQ